MSKKKKKFKKINRPAKGKESFKFRSLIRGIIQPLVVGIILIIMQPHLVAIWPVTQSKVVSSPRSDYSTPQSSPALHGAYSYNMEIDNYVNGVQIESSATIYNNQSQMTPFLIKAIVPPSDNLTEGYTVAPEDIVNWVHFNTGNTVFIEPNSKVTADIIFKVPLSYRNKLPDKWQFNISVELKSASQVKESISPSDAEKNLENQAHFNWLVNMRDLESFKILLWVIRILLITDLIVTAIFIWKGRKKGKYQELSFIFLALGIPVLVIGITLILLSSLSIIEALSLRFSIIFSLVGLIITIVGLERNTWGKNR